MLSGMRRLVACSWLAALTGLTASGNVNALALGPDFVASYTVSSLGSVPGLPPLYGGLTFLDADTLLIGGNANTAAGRFYKVDVVRGAGGHITGFSGSVSVFGSVGEFNDGGIAFSPGGVLFTSRWPVNQLAQTKPGSTDEDKIIDLGPFGVASSHAALGFVPAGFGGAGKLKLVSWSGGQFYTATISPDGGGTFDITAVVHEDLDSGASGIQNVPGGPEGFVYIDGANAGFAGDDSMLIAEYSAGAVGAYDLDSDGNPLVSTRRDFLTGLSGAEGAVIDPVTGDFLFSTFGSGNQVVRVSGFIAPPCGVPGAPDCQIPEPGTLPMSGLALLGFALAAAGRRARQSVLRSPV